MKKIILVSVILITTAILVSSCSSSFTDISGTWTKPGFTGKKFKKILVVAISNDIIKRNTVESALVKELDYEKFKATTSEGIIDFSNVDKNKDGKLDSAKRDALVQKISDAGYDGVIVMSLLDIKEQTQYVPGQTYYQPSYYGGYYGGYGGYYGGFYGYSSYTYGVVSTPGYYVETKNVFIETRLFDLSKDDMVWATKTETLNPSNLKELSGSLSRAIVNTLVKDDVLK